MVEPKKARSTLEIPATRPSSGDVAWSRDEDDLSGTRVDPPPSDGHGAPSLGQTVRLGSAPSAAGAVVAAALAGQQPAQPVQQANRPSQTVAPASVETVRGPSGIELVAVEERELPGGERRPWRAAEVWTKRRVYGLDSTFRCVEVLDRETGRLEVSHELIGARLGGGRWREAAGVRFSYPLPLPGMEAMFTKGKKHGYTSRVERMVVRIRVLYTAAGEVAPTWEDIASRWSDLPPRP